MCIRDSFWKSGYVPPGAPEALRLRRATMAPGAKFGEPRAFFPLQARGRVAVSYTHLTLPTICSV
eukprot:6872346-Alexandrium_andersonii.AAC.1